MIELLFATLLAASPRQSSAPAIEAVEYLTPSLAIVRGSAGEELALIAEDGSRVRIASLAGAVPRAGPCGSVALLASAPAGSGVIATLYQSPSSQPVVVTLRPEEDLVPGCSGWLVTPRVDHGENVPCALRFLDTGGSAFATLDRADLVLSRVDACGDGWLAESIDTDGLRALLRFDRRGALAWRAGVGPGSRPIVTLSEDGRRIVVGRWSGPEAEMFEVEILGPRGERVGSCTLPPYEVADVTPDGDRLAFAGRGEMTLVAQTGEVLRSIVDPAIVPAPGRSLSLTARAGCALIVCIEQREDESAPLELRGYDLTSGELVERAPLALRAEAGPIVAIQSSPDGAVSITATGGRANTAR